MFCPYDLKYSNNVREFQLKNDNWWRIDGAVTDSLKTQWQVQPYSTLRLCTRSYWKNAYYCVTRPLVEDVLGYLRLWTFSKNALVTYSLNSEPWRSCLLVGCRDCLVLVKSVFRRTKSIKILRFINKDQPWVYW